MIPEISIFHPYDHDEKYIDWKARAAKCELKDDEKGGYYEQNT
jgi:hypothetical protein